MFSGCRSLLTCSMFNNRDRWCALHLSGQSHCIETCSTPAPTRSSQSCYVFRTSLFIDRDYFFTRSDVELSIISKYFFFDILLRSHRFLTCMGVENIHHCRRHPDLHKISCASRIHVPSSSSASVNIQEDLVAFLFIFSKNVKLMCCSIFELAVFMTRKKCLPKAILNSER